MEYDLLVLGAGSGGMAAAVRAAEYGAKVAVVEAHYPGGTCVNLGCVPKKVMYNAATIAHNLQKSCDYGFSPPEIRLDWPTLVSRRENYIKFLRSIYLKRFKQFNIDLIEDFGQFCAPGLVKVNQKEVSAKHIIIAVGGEPIMPSDINGIHLASSSDGFFALNQQPKSAAIIGSGYIGVEIACVLNSLGTKVHLLMRGKNPLSRFDAMLSNALAEQMRADGIHLYENHQAKIIENTENNKKNIICSKGSVIADLDVVIAAVGRKPRTKPLHLNKASIKLDSKDRVIVDAYQNTSAENVYAIGDVTNAPALTPVAIAAGRRLCDRLFGKKKNAKLNLATIPTVVFTHPPIGTVGLSESEAKAQFGSNNIKIYQQKFTPMFDALSTNKTPMTMKLIVTGENEKIIGLHLIGAQADEILQGFAVALSMGACKKDFDNTIAIHPTSAEELVTMR